MRASPEPLPPLKLGKDLLLPADPDKAELKLNSGVRDRGGHSKRSAGLEGLGVDSRTISVVGLEKLPPKQRDILMHFNRRCLFCRAAVKTYDTTDARCILFNDRKNGKIYIGHRKCASKALQTGSPVLRASKLNAFQIMMEDDDFIQQDF